VLGAHLEHGRIVGGQKAEHEGGHGSDRGLAAVHASIGSLQLGDGAFVADQGNVAADVLLGLLKGAGAEPACSMVSPVGQTR
jgi:hypothetical protein